MLDVKLWMHVGMVDTLLYNQGLACGTATPKWF